MTLAHQTRGDSPGYTGTQINYYFVCKRKLWLFSHGLNMEHTSDLVSTGKLIHEEGYKRKFKEVEIDHIKIDFIERGGVEIHEVKKSKRIEKAHRYQLLYYLYYLYKKGIVAKGVINYPLLRKTVKEELTDENRSEIEEILFSIESLLSMENAPSPVKRTYCRKCSYYELCWS